MDYTPEDTVIEFDVGDYFVSLWIDCYYGDSEYDDDPQDCDLDGFPSDIQRNAVKCGRGIDPKEGLDGMRIMFGHRYVMAGDVQELYRRFEQLMMSEIASFDSFPEHDESGKAPSFFSFHARRDGNGAFIVLSFRDYGSDDDFEFHITEEKLAEVCNWLKRVTEWFPPVGPNDMQVRRWPKG